MISSIAQADLVSLIAGEIDAATLASRHGVTEEEALRWRAVFVAGMKAGVGGRTASRRLPSRMIGVASAVLATAAFAQLAVFSPNSPALATEVNGNFTQLKAWLETKVGPVTNATIRISPQRGTHRQVGPGTRSRRPRTRAATGLPNAAAAP